MEMTAVSAGNVAAAWLPFDVTSPAAWREWLAANQGMVAACGAGAAAVALMGAYVLSAGRRRH